MKIAVSIIVGERYEELDKCLHSIDGLYDYISCTIVRHKGAKVDRTIEVAERYGAIMSEYIPEWNKPMIDDFSAARNVSLDNIPVDTDWIMCMDSDDTLQEPVALRMYLKDVQPCIVRLNIVGENVFMQNRIWHTSLGIRWVGRIHEQLTSAGIDTIHCDTNIYHKRKDKPKNMARNLVILKDKMDKNTATIRDVFYYADGLFYCNFNNSISEEMRESLKYFRKVINDKSLEDYYRFTSMLHFTEVHFFKATRDKTPYEKAIQYAMRTISINPVWHEPYYIMGVMMFNIEQFNLARGWFEHCLSLPTDISTWSVMDRHKESREMLAKITEKERRT